MAIFHFEEAGDWNRACCHSDIKCVPSRIFRRVQQPCQVLIAANSIALLLSEIILILFTPLYLHNWWRHQCQIYITGKLYYFWNKKRYHKKKNAILLYFKKPFKWAYFWNDLFFGSCALYEMVRVQCATTELWMHADDC